MIASMDRYDTERHKAKLEYCREEQEYRREERAYRAQQAKDDREYKQQQHSLFTNLMANMQHMAPTNFHYPSTPN